MDDRIVKFQEKLHAEYLGSIGVNEPACFASGNPVLPVVPKEVTPGGIMILGAYPTAEFKTVARHRVPMDNIDRPFHAETDSGRELYEHYLKPLGIDRAECWITNLVKVFLFKKDHQRGLGTIHPSKLERDNFLKIADSEQNRQWLSEELQLAVPKIVITLGAEVAGFLQEKKSRKKRNALLTGGLASFELEGRVFKAIHFAHPGIIMRKTKNQVISWREIHANIHVPAAREVLLELNLIN